MRVNVSFQSEADWLGLVAVARDMRITVGAAARSLLVGAVETYNKSKRIADENENPGGYEQLTFLKRSRGKK